MTFHYYFSVNKIFELLLYFAPQKKANVDWCIFFCNDANVPTIELFLFS